MTGSDVTNIDAQRGISFISSPYIGAISLDFLIRGNVHSCPYIPGMGACEQVFMAESFSPEMYHDFMDIGFRRSGCYFYRPDCDNCRECRPIRTVLSDFSPSKSQRRVLRKNEDVTISIAAPKFTREKNRLYNYYLESRHNAHLEAPASELKSFLYSSPVQTIEFEYKLRGKLIAVSLADICSRSLSSVYVYFDPDRASRSLGTLSALREMVFARDYHIPYYYLGFWIPDCGSMNYKDRFKPYELLNESYEWVVGLKSDF
jgi:leucyl-tRNA---protein transferase